MKLKEQKDVYEVVAGVILYRDDIEEILFRFQNASMKVEICDSTKTYENIDELIQSRGNNPSEFDVKGTLKDWDYVNIYFEKSRVRISGRGMSTEMRLLGVEFKDFFLSKTAQLCENKIMNLASG